MFKVATTADQFIIAPILSEDSDTVYLRSPMVMDIFPTNDGQLHMQTNRWVPFTESDVVGVRRDMMIAYSTPSRLFINYYVERITEMPTDPRDKILTAMLQRVRERKMDAKVNSPFTPTRQ